MWIAGVLIPASAVARLARLLDIAGHGDLATRVGWAVDRNRSELRLNREERARIANALEINCPTNLEALRRALAEPAVSARHRRAS